MNFDDGTFEYHYQGAHSDIKKTKELQDQGECVRMRMLRNSVATV